MLRLTDSQEWSSDSLHCIPVSQVTVKKIRLGSPSSPSPSREHYPERPYPVLPFPDASELVELPTCITCLERMDAVVTGLSSSSSPTTLYHSSMRKTNPGCPICCLIVAKASSARQDRFCATCLSGKNIWMCIICGQLSCGRYESKHAQVSIKTCLTLLT